jgi:hypothetical protein
MLEGALVFGARLRVSYTNSSFGVALELDPLEVKLAVLSNPGASIGLGLLELSAGLDAAALGEFGFHYCSSGTSSCVPPKGYEQWKKSSFYFKRKLSYLLAGEVSLSLGNAKVNGFKIEKGLSLSIENKDVFDNMAPVIKLPNVKSLKDMLQFSPQNAVEMLRIIESVLISAATNPIFDMNIPILDRKFSEIFVVARMFTARLYEFFVMSQPFEQRQFKSLTMSGSLNIKDGDLLGDAELELYVIRNLTVNPIPGNIFPLRNLAESEGVICPITFLNQYNHTPGQFVDEIVKDITSCNGLRVIKRTSGYVCNETVSDKGVIQEIFGCNYDLVVGVDDKDNFFMTTVSYKDSEKTNASINDIQLLGIYNTTDKIHANSEALAVDILGISVNSPTTPAAVPRFTTIQVGFSVVATCNVVVFMAVIFSFQY